MNNTSTVREQGDPSNSDVQKLVSLELEDGEIPDIFF